MTDTRRLDSLKRRVQQDPASIAFAALADEYRRLGLFHDAIETCRAGLTRHPAYISARVTLGRSLLEIGEYDEAQTELEQVIRAAPDNLAAIRALAEIHRRRGDAPYTYTMDGHDPAAAGEPTATPPAPAATAPAAAPKALAPVDARSPAEPARPAPVAHPPAPATVEAPGRAPAATGAEPPEVPATGHGPAAPAPLPLSTFAPDGAPLEIVSHRAAPEAAPVPPAPAPPVAAPPAPAPPVEAAAAPAAAVPAADPVCARLEQFLAAIDRARADEARVGVAPR